MKNRGRWIWGLLIACSIAAAATFKLRTTALDVSAASVQRGPLKVVVTEEAQTRLKERYVVAAPVAGLLTRSQLREGDVVKLGDPIARIFPAPTGVRDARVEKAQLSGSIARRKQAAAQVGELQSHVAQLARSLERSRSLLASGAVSSAEVENEELALLSARQQLEAANAAVRASEADTAAIRAVMQTGGKDSSAASVLVSAPNSGQVLQLLEENERVVQSGTPLLAIGNPSQLEVVVSILSEDAIRVEIGAEVLIDDWGGEGTLHGEVRRIAPEAFTQVSTLGVEEQRVHVIAELKSNPPKLGAGYRVQASIVVWSSTDALLVPTSALFQSGDGWSVYAIENGVSVSTPVRIGHRSTDSAEVLEGLREGNQVISFPSAQLQNGTAVRSQKPAETN